jgi:hypothetical protein
MPKQGGIRYTFEEWSDGVMLILFWLAHIPIFMSGVIWKASQMHAYQFVWAW